MANEVTDRIRVNLKLSPRLHKAAVDHARTHKLTLQGFIASLIKRELGMEPTREEFMRPRAE